MYRNRKSSFGLNSGGLSPTMNAVAATLFWSQASFGLNSVGLTPAMNAAALQQAPSFGLNSAGLSLTMKAVKSFFFKSFLEVVVEALSAARRHFVVSELTKKITMQWPPF
jgi:hypothetical protein